MLPFSNSEQLLLALGRKLTASDAIAVERLIAAEQRLGITLPQAVATFYQYAGAAPELQEHDRLRAPEALDVDDGFLIFMEENQRVVHWGIPSPFGAASDPMVWQRVNGERPAWHSEEMTFSAFVARRLAWTRGVSLRDDPSSHRD